MLKEGLLGLEDGPGAAPRAGAGAVDRTAPASSPRSASTSARMKEGQDAIYYLTAATRSAAERSPHLEAFRAKGYEVLFFTDPVDELWLRMRREFEGKKLVSVAAAAATPQASDEEAKKDEEAREEQEEGCADLLDTLRAKLQDHVKDVRLSIAAHRIARLPGRRRGRHLAAPARAAAALRSGGAGGQAHARAERRAPDRGPSSRSARRRPERPEARALRRSSVRPGAAGRGRAPARSGGVQPAARRADGDASLIRQVTRPTSKPS